MKASFPIAPNIKTTAPHTNPSQAPAFSPSIIRAGSVSLDWIDNKIDLNYHAGSMTQIPYEFYAYYLDDLQVDESDYTRTDDAVKIKVEIDGRRDLMSAKAEITEAHVKFEGYGKVKSQSVKAGTELKKGSVINLVLSAK